MRKKSAGEAKASNAEEGWVKRSFFRRCRVRSVHGAAKTSCSEIAWLMEENDGVVDGEGIEVVIGVREAATPVQSKIPSRTISPAIGNGSFLEERLSVRAREVASVPPRWEP